RTSLEVSIRNIPPTDPHVVRLPQPPAGRSHVIGLGITDNPRPTIRPSSTKRPDGAPLQRLEDRVVVVRGGLSRKWNCKKGNKKQRDYGFRHAADNTLSHSQATRKSFPSERTVGAAL